MNASLSLNSCSLLIPRVLASASFSTAPSTTLACAPINPRVVKSVLFCPCNFKLHISRVSRYYISQRLPIGSVYPTRDDNGNLLVTEYGLCKYKDHQTLSMQEVPEKSAPIRLPRTMDIIVEDDLVDTCKPTDHITMANIYKAVLRKSKGSMSGVFRDINMMMVGDPSVAKSQLLRAIMNIAPLVIPTLIGAVLVLVLLQQ